MVHASSPTALGTQSRMGENNRNVSGEKNYFIKFENNKSTVAEEHYRNEKKEVSFNFSGFEFLLLQPA